MLSVASPEAAVEKPASGLVGAVLTVLAAATALPVLPLELGLGRVSVALSLAVAVVVAAIALRSRDGGHAGRGVRTVLLLLGAWAAARLVPLAFLYGEPVELGQVLREVGAFAAAAGALSLGRNPRTRPGLVRGLRWAFAITVALGVYQVFAGLGRLQAAGYNPESGFTYYVFGGDYRPFGLFTGPTTYATFVAMLGVFVTCTSRGARSALAAVATIGVVIATETRAAVLALCLVALAVALISPRIRRIGAIWLFGPILAVVSVILAPQLYASTWSRLLSATDTTDRSRATRTETWHGVVEATAGQGRTLEGLGGADWGRAMSNWVPPDVLLAHAHSNFFQQWFLYGVVGVVLFISLLFALVALAWRQQRRSGSWLTLAGLGAVIVFVVDSVFNNSLSSINYLVGLFLIVGLAAQDSHSPEHGEAAA